MKYSEGGSSIQENVVFDFLSRIRNKDVNDELKQSKRKVKQYRRDFLRASAAVAKSMEANDKAWQTKISLGNAYDVATELFKAEDEIRDIWCSSPAFDEAEYQKYQDEVFAYRKKWLKLWTSAWMYIFDKNQKAANASNDGQESQNEGAKTEKSEIFVMTPDFASQKARNSVGLIFPVAVIRQRNGNTCNEPSQEQMTSEQNQQQEQKQEQDQTAQVQQQNKNQQSEENHSDQKVAQERKTQREKKTQQEQKGQRNKVKSAQKSHDQKVQEEQPVQHEQSAQQTEKVQKTSKPQVTVKIVGKVIRAAPKACPPRIQDLEKCELPEGGMVLRITDIGHMEAGRISGYRAGDPHAKFVYDVLPKKMADYCLTEAGRQPYTPENNELCIVQLPHGRYLRGVMVNKVVGNGGMQANVKYIDYGHSERVPLTSIRRMPRQFVKGIPAVTADLYIKNFPKTVTSRMIINASTYLQVPDEDGLRLTIKKNEKTSPGSYIIEAPEFLEAMMQ